MRRVLLLLLVLLPMACAQTGPTRPGDDAGAAYDVELQAAAALYRTGLEQAARGEVSAGHESIERASTRLRELASACVARSDCDGDRVVAVYDSLLARRAEASEVDGNGNGGGGAATTPVTAVMPATATISILNGRELRDVIELNDPVKAALTEWLTWMRPQLLTSWDNYQFMRHLMWPEYERAGLPEAILFGILAKESGGRVHAISSAGATGPLQFMYQTGLRFGLGRVDGFDTRYDPQLSARANVSYLQERLAELDGDLELALAAYNGGEGRVGRLHRANPGKRFWDPEIYSQLPPETREYVPMVLAAAWLYLHADEYGLEFGPVDTRPGSVLLVRDATLNELAICIGSSGAREGWFRVLRNLNARYQTGDVIAAGSEVSVPRQLEPVYYSQCVDEGRATLARTLVSARVPAQVQTAAAASATGASHTVRRGDTLASIARRYGCGSPAALARANGISGPNYLIRAGQRIELVGCSG